MAQKEETGDMTANLVAYIKEKDARIQKLEEDLAAANKRREKRDDVYSRLHPELQNGEKKEEKKEEKPPEPLPKHIVGWYDKDCPTCGVPNDQYKDETFCYDCFGDLGAAEKAVKVAACPHCGKKADEGLTIMRKTDPVYDRYKKALEKLKKELIEDGIKISKAD